MHALKKPANIVSRYSVVAITLLVTAFPALAESRGETLYKQHCSACHQPEGKGIPAVIPPLAANPLVTSNDPEKIQDYLARVIFGYHGALIVDNQVYYGNMPPIGYQGRINDSELLDLINYQRTAWGNDARPITAMDLAEARRKGAS